MVKKIIAVIIFILIVAGSANAENPIDIVDNWCRNNGMEYYVTRETDRSDIYRMTGLIYSLEDCEEFGLKTIDELMDFLLNGGYEAFLSEQLNDEIQVTGYLLATVNGMMIYKIVIISESADLVDYVDGTQTALFIIAGVV